MRLDKYLKTSRLIRRRTVADEACSAGRVLVNGKEAKSSYRLTVGDVIQINLGQHPITVEVTELLDHATKETAPSMYRQID